jgi:spermidine synthase
MSSRTDFNPVEGGKIRWTQLYLGLGVTTLATLILELSLTRIFSVVFYYHFAFLAISIALFGLGAGGVFSYVVAGSGGRLYSKLGTLGLANGACVVLSLWFILSRSGLSITTLVLVYFASALPFFLTGTVVSIAISEAMERVDRAYFFDLAGASAGCLLLIPWLNWFGGPNTVIAAAVLYCIAAVFWFSQENANVRRAVAALSALVLTILMTANVKLHFIDISSAKGSRLPPERFTAWNSFSRIGVSRVEIASKSKAAWNIVIDGDASTEIAGLDWDRGLSDEDRFKLLHEGPGFPYALRPGAKALIIGPGGGYDVARALASGSRDITAVEINPIIANTVMRDKFLADSHRIYERPEVRVFVEDGRSFVRGSSEKYQVVQATLVDTWASTAAGAFALSENNLYTTDAFYDYLSHLTPDGILAFSRWGFDPPRESLRLISLAIEALDRLGGKDVAHHVMAVRQATGLLGWGDLDTVVVSRAPFNEEDVARARRILSDAHIDALYLPGDPPTNPFGELALASDPRSFFAHYSYDVSPVGDDRPFFFYTVQPRDLWTFFRHGNRQNADYKVNRAVPLLFGLMGISLAATALVLVLPRWLFSSRLPKQKGVMTFLWYFLCLGAGYILIQVALIQKFVLLLGHPTYALTVIVFSMLVSSGLGSYFSRKFVAGQDSRLGLILILIAVLVSALAIGVRPLVSAAAAWPLGVKMALTALSIAPAGFLMGMPFPSGLRRLEKRHAPSVRWAWSLNAAASVLGSTGAIFLAIYLGLRATLLIGAGLYLCALVVILATIYRPTAIPRA